MAQTPNEPERFPTVDIASRIDLLLPQYSESTALRTLFAALVDILQAEVIDPLERMDRASNPNESSGVILDWLGLRLGLARPFVRAADTEYFGFEGTAADVGQPFDSAPFVDLRSQIEDVEPLGDASYRLLLLARARRLRGGADRETIEAVLARIWPNGNGYLDESVTPIVLRVTAPLDNVWRLASGALFGLLFPRPAGRAMSIVRS